MPIPLRDTNLAIYYKTSQKVMDLARSKGIHVLNFAEELRRLCKLTGYNFPGLFMQAWHETAGFTSDLWLNNKNPAGIKSRTGRSYQKYYNGVDAARALLVHMSAYTSAPSIDNTLKNFRYLDERYLLALEANKGKFHRTFHDLNGRWAEDKEYGQQIEALYKRLIGV